MEAREFGTRIKKIADAISRPGPSKADAFLAVCRNGIGWEDIYYLTGFSGTSGALVITGGDSRLFVDSRYAGAAEEARIYANVSVLTGAGVSPLGAALEYIENARASRVAFGGSDLSLTLYREISRVFGDSCLVDLSRVLAGMRRRKSKYEIGCIIEAIRMASGAFAAAAARCGPGMTERQFAARLEFEIAEHGGLPAMRTIVASGARTAMPHAFPTGKKFERGDMIVVDFGVRQLGYVCDITRMMSAGEAEENVRKLYSILRWAQEEAAALVCHGRAASEIDGAARGVMEVAGLGEYFIHGLGHGIGLAVHEAPPVSRVSGALLADGDVITLEPGFYRPGCLGMRVEDDYLVTKTGAEKLSAAFDPEITVVG
ncbi:MAG: Xaa-Pro peptidase family protein [Synergistaceae bacterium]|nr:Xaa-Pro peptidase family protein [Synergistaceae bacterium]